MAFTVQRGDDNEWELTLSQGGAALDLTGVAEIWLTFRFKAANPRFDTDDSNVIAQLSLGTGEIVVVDAAAGRADATMGIADSRKFTRTKAEYDVQVRLNSGKVKTSQRGTVQVLDEVTVSV